MQLTRQRKVGRFINPTTKRPVNVYQSDWADRGVTVTYYFYRGKKQLISDREFYHQWKRQDNDQ